MRTDLVDKNLKSQMRRLDNQKRHTIAVKEQEIENLKKFYNSKTKETQLAGAASINSAKDSADKRLLEAIESEEQKLGNYRQKMKSAQKLLEENKNQLLKARQSHVQDIHQQMQEVVAREHEKGREYIQDISHKNQNFIRDLDRSTNNQQVALRNQARSAINHEAQVNELKVKLQEDRIRKQRNLKDIEFAKMIAAEKMAHNRYLKKLYAKNNVQKMHQEKASDQVLKENQEFHKRRIQQEEEIFKNKMASVIKQHTALHTRIKNRLLAEIEQVKNQYTKFKNNIINKSQDDFYTIRKLNPQVTDFGNEYVIAIETPKHEMENYNFSANTRNLKLSLNRRFDQRIENPTGGFHKSRRSEVITKEFKVEDIVDPATITRKYEDGILMFKIAKL